MSKSCKTLAIEALEEVLELEELNGGLCFHFYRLPDRIKYYLVQLLHDYMRAKFGLKYFGYIDEFDKMSPFRIRVVKDMIKAIKHPEFRFRKNGYNHYSSNLIELKLYSPKKSDARRYLSDFLKRKLTTNEAVVE